VAADRPLIADAVVAAAIDPAGDEDIFALRNDDVPRVVRLNIYDRALGRGSFCLPELDDVIHIRDAAGTCSPRTTTGPSAATSARGSCL
jgi:hypothetical protein